MAAPAIAIQIGGIAPLAPQRKKDIASLGLKAVLGGSPWMKSKNAGRSIESPLRRRSILGYFFSTGTLISVRSSSGFTSMGLFRYFSMQGPAGLQPWLSTKANTFA